MIGPAAHLPLRQPRRISFAGLLAALLLVLLTYAGAALAAHYHTFNNREHGLVHGSSTTDGAFFGRTYGFYFTDTNYCAVGDTAVGYYGDGYSYSNNLCSVWSLHYTADPDECRGVTAHFSTTSPALSQHTHLAHNYNGAGCRVHYT